MRAGISKRVPELIARMALARQLNELNGCMTFHAWNVGDIPFEDWQDVDEYVRGRDAD